MAAMVGAFIGIDVGTSYMCVGVWQQDRVEIITNEYGNRTTPSYVAFTPTESLVGDDARAAAQVATNAANTVFDAQRLMGRAFSDRAVQSYRKHWPFKVIEGPGGKPLIKVHVGGEERCFAAEEICSMLLSKMKGLAEAHLGREVRHAIITMPTCSNNAQRQAMRDAAAMAGLNVLRLYGAPTMAAITYDMDLFLMGTGTRTGSERNVLMFDLGSGTLDVSLIIIEEGIYEVKATANDMHLGGNDFDSRMVDYFAEEFKRSPSGTDLTADCRALWRLRAACERAKRTLSSSAVAPIEIDALVAGAGFSSTITRTRFEDMNMDYCYKCIEPVEKVLRDAKLNKRHVHEVVLLGGSARIPKIQQLLRDFFGIDSATRGPRVSVIPNEAAARGATVMAALLCGYDKSDKLSNLILMDAVPVSLGVVVTGTREPMRTFLKRNTTTPAKKTQSYCVDADSPREVVIQVYEGERALPEDNTLLGELRLGSYTPLPPGELQVDVTLDVDANGRLTVRAVEKSTAVEREDIIYS